MDVTVILIFFLLILNIYSIILESKSEKINKNKLDEIIKILKDKF